MSKLDIQFLETLWQTLEARKNASKEESYTRRLLDGGKRKVSSKLMEEAAETVTAVFSESDKRVVEEASDLIYHLMVLLMVRNLDFGEVIEELKRRHR